MKVRNRLLVVACLASAWSCISSAGERFTEAGNALGRAIDEELIRRRFCNDAAGCQRVLEIYGGHGDQVNFTAYGINDRNRDALAIVVEVITRRGLSITGGIPIKFQGRRMTHDEYIGSGIFRARDVVLTLEVKR